MQYAEMYKVENKYTMGLLRQIILIKIIQ